MNGFDQEFYEKYKERERKQNEIIRDWLNSPEIIRSCSEMLEIHLDQIQIERVLVQHWLTCNDCPNKDEIAAIANNVIQVEERVDELEDTIYRMCKEWNEKIRTITALKESMFNMKLTLENSTSRENDRIQILKNELEDVKLLFK